MPKVGAGKAEVELVGVLPFDGFDGQLDSIFVRALVVEAQTRCCIVSVEMTSLRPDVVASLRAIASDSAGCPCEATWVCATHTFSVPHVRTASHLGGDAEREKNSRLSEAVRIATRKAVLDAVGALCDATMSVARGVISVNVNRDVETPGGWWIGTNREGYSDHGVRELAFRRTSDDSAIAVLFSADVQSSVLLGSHDGSGRRLVTGDLAGRASVIAEEALPGSVALFLVGAAGDQAPVVQAVTTTVSEDGSLFRQDAGDAGISILDRLGATFGRDVLEALEHETPIDCHTVEAREIDVVCPGQERADFASLHPNPSYEYSPAPERSTAVRTLRIGSLVLVGVAPELSSCLGNLVRVGCRAPLVDVVTLVNGGEKYLPSSEAYERRTYEAMNSGFGRGSAEVLLRAAIEAADAIYESGQAREPGGNQ